MKKILFLISFLISTSLLFGQQIFTVKITDAKTAAPLAGASVKVKSTTKGATTNSEGIAKIEAKTHDILQISNIGYDIQNITLTNELEVSVAMEAASVDLGDVVVLGTRGAARAKIATAVPIDVIKINQVGLPTAKMNLTSVLNMAAPSFNYNKQSGADGADHIDLGALRGLGPDQTLVLINGKRRHQTAFVALFGTRGRGNSGVDLNGFPQSAVDRIEILRDGASAQYGSDAIAGVINVVLKKDINHWTVNTGWSGYYDPHYNASQTKETNNYYYGQPIDGSTFALNANNGLALGKKGGYINFSLDLLTQSKTYRQVADTNLAATTDALPVNTGRRAFGDGSVSTAGAMYNMELPIGTSGATTFYSFGGYNYKASDAYAYTRNLSGRPDRFPIDANGDPIFVPSIMRTTDYGGPEVYYNPHIQTKISDGSLALGIKGKMSNDWTWDLSNTLGRNNFHYFGDQTFNASMIGNITKTHFDDGGFNFLQNTVNLDFSKSFNSFAEGLNLALGGEYRFERYAIYQGEEASYTAYPNNFGQAPGAQGFPGFSPSDAITATRSTESVYADIELNVTKKWLLDMALRFEYYSDFGFVNTSKIATRYSISNNFNLRASISTGFRAPSLQQINFNNTLTSFSGGQLVQSLISRNGSPVTESAGIPDLTEETSNNASIGFAWKPMRNLTITVDGYAIKVMNRIVLSGLFTSSDTTLPPALIANLNAANVATAQFFDNAVNTTNFGLDIVVDYTKKFTSNSGIKALLAGNLQHMTVNQVNVPATLNTSYRLQKTFFSDREEAFLLASAPKAKFSLNLEYNYDKLTIGTNFIYFGNMQSKGFGWTGYADLYDTGLPGDPLISGSFAGIDPYVDEDQYLDANYVGNGVNILPETFVYTPKVTTDVFVSYKFSNSISLFLGVDNLFNVHPNFAAVSASRRESFDNETGGAWESVQMGFNGRRLFTKLAFNF
jgi:iron complex outermembrane receptor protein